MIARLQGMVVGRTLTSIYLDVGGIGFEVFMTISDLDRVSASTGEVTVFTYMHVTDAGMAMYGFLTEEAKAMFEKLIGVGGIGPKAAVAALNTFSPSALADAIAAQDVNLIQRIPGVGKKTASRLILELKGSLDHGIPGLFVEPTIEGVLSDRLDGATEALLSMGFSATEAELALKGAPEGATEAALLQYALKRLGN